MALERIDPISLEDCYAVDHLLRYAVIAPQAKGKRVLDAASGLGFGSVLLLHQDAAAVVGVDLSEEAVAISRERWQDPRLTFHARDLEELAQLDVEPFDLITTFETLEHVAQPEKVLRAFRDVLRENGVVIGSVPGITDKREQNEFHLHHFDQQSLRELLEAEFRQVHIFRQEFSIRSRIEPLESSPEPDSLCWSNTRNLTIDFGRAGEEEDSLFFLASDGPLPALELPSTASSRNAWLRLRSEYLTALQELDSFSAKYRKLFLDHGDLKVKFANMLGWGKWHFEQLNGRNPTDTEIERVEKATSQREEGLRDQVNQLMEENLHLKAQLAAAADQLGKALDLQLRNFEEGSQSLKNPD